MLEPPRHPSAPPAARAAGGRGRGGGAGGAHLAAARGGGGGAAGGAPGRAGGVPHPLWRCCSRLGALKKKKKIWMLSQETDLQDSNFEGGNGVPPTHRPGLHRRPPRRGRGRPQGHRRRLTRSLVLIHWPAIPQTRISLVWETDSPDRRESQGGDREGEAGSTAWGGMADPPDAGLQVGGPGGAARTPSRPSPLPSTPPRPSSPPAAPCRGRGPGPEHRAEHRGWSRARSCRPACRSAR